jgi:hypothetical protein
MGKGIGYAWWYVYSSSSCSSTTGDSASRRRLQDSNARGRILPLRPSSLPTRLEHPLHAKTVLTLRQTKTICRNHPPGFHLVLYFVSSHLPLRARVDISYLLICHQGFSGEHPLRLNTTSRSYRFTFYSVELASLFVFQHPTGHVRSLPPIY